MIRYSTPSQSEETTLSRIFSTRKLRLSAILLFLSARVGGLGQAQEKPRITSIEPKQGPIAGATRVTIRGSALTAAGGPVSVKFGALSGTNIATISSTELQVTSPAQANGFVPVTVSTPNGTATGEFFYYPPSLDSLRPGEITTVAGIGKYLGEGRPAKEVPIHVEHVTIDRDGNVYIAQPDNGVINRIGPDGIMTRFAGIGASFAGDDIGDGKSALDATLVFPHAAVVGPDGNVYIADSFNHRVRKVDVRAGIITTVAGSGPNGTCCLGTYGGDGGPAVQAKLNQPNQFAFDARGNLYILDTGNYRIRKVSPDGIITTMAGTGRAGFSGDGGLSTQAEINPGEGADFGTVKVDTKGNIFLLDERNGRIRKIDAGTGIIQTVVGGGTRTEDGIPGLQLLYQGHGMALDKAGNLYFGDNSRIRRVGADGVVSTVYGGPVSGYSPDGTAFDVGRVTNVGRMHVDDSGNILFVEFSNRLVRRIDAQTRTISTVAGIVNDFGERGPASAFNVATAGFRQLAITPENKVVFASGDKVRRMESDGTLFTIAGNEFVDPNARIGEDRPALATPVVGGGIAVDHAGNVYTSGRGIHRIRPDAILSTLVPPEFGFAGDGGPSKEARLDNPGDIDADVDGNLFVADGFNHRIRRIDSRTGIITTFAGTAPPHKPNELVQNPSTGDGGPALQAQMNVPNHVAVDRNGNVYFADTNRIRWIDSRGIVDTFLPECFGPLSKDRNGTVYAYCNGAILRLDRPRQATTIARTGLGPISGDGSPSENAGVGFVSGFAIDDFGNVFLAAWEHRRIRAIKGILPASPSVFFPQFANGQGTTSAIVLTNPSAVASVSGQIALLDTNGNRLAGIVGTTTGTSSFTIPPFGSVVFNSNGQGNLVVASARLSVNSHVGGIVRFAIPGLGITAVDASRRMPGFLIPVRTSRPLEMDTGFAIANTTGKTLTINLSLRDAQGHEVATAVRSLPPNGQIARFISEIFPDSTTNDFQGTMTANVDRGNGGGTVVAVGLELRSGPGEFTTLPITELDGGYLPTTLHFAQFANGTGIVSNFILVNPSSRATVSGKMEFFDDNGNALNVRFQNQEQLNLLNFNIPPLGVVTFNSDGVGNVMTGSAVVTANRPVGAIVRFGASGSGLAGVGASTPVNGFIIPIRRNKNQGVDSGIAIANVGSAPTRLELVLRNSEGQEIQAGRRTVEMLSAKGHLARLISELFPSASIEEFVGTVTVSADSSTQVAATALELNAGKLTALPVTPLRR